MVQGSVEGFRLLDQSREKIKSSKRLSGLRAREINKESYEMEEN